MSHDRSVAPNAEKLLQVLSEDARVDLAEALLESVEHEPVRSAFFKALAHPSIACGALLANTAPADSSETRVPYG